MPPQPGFEPGTLLLWSNSANSKALTISFWDFPFFLCASTNFWNIYLNDTESFLHVGAVDWAFQRPSDTWYKTPNPDKLKKCQIAGTNGDKGGGSLNHFPPCSSLKVCDQWWIKWLSLERWQGCSTNIRKAELFVSPKPGCRNNSNSTLSSFETIWADKNCRQRGNGERACITVLVYNRWYNPGYVTYKERICTSKLNYWLWVSVHIVYWENSPGLPISAVYDIINKATKTTPPTIHPHHTSLCYTSTFQIFVRWFLFYFVI